MAAASSSPGSAVCGRASASSMMALVLSLLVGAPASPARAAEWLLATGPPEGRHDDVTVFGFAQLLAESTPWSEPVTGLESTALQPFNGQTLQSEIDGAMALTVRRARLGARGVVPRTQRRLSFVAAVDAGQSGLTRGRGVVLVDAALSLRVTSGLVLRVGQFKLPQADESLESNPQAAMTTRFSLFIPGLLVEGADDEPSSSRRDGGVEVYDALPVPLGQGALVASYAVMASLGRAPHQLADAEAWAAQGAHVLRAGPDVTTRLQLSLVPERSTWRSPARDEVSVWVWHQSGGRALDAAQPGEVTLRLRQGAGMAVRLRGVRVRVEAVGADGALPQPGAFAGQKSAVVARGRAHGGSVDVTLWRVAGWQLPVTPNLSLDWLARNPDDAAGARVFQGVTASAALQASRTVRVLAAAELRRQLVGPQPPADAARLASGVSPLLSAQVALSF